MGLEARFGALEMVLTTLRNASDPRELSEALTQIHDEAHRLGGTASMFGALELGRAARALELECNKMLDRSGKISSHECESVAALTDVMMKFTVGPSLYDGDVEAVQIEAAEAPEPRNASIFVLDDDTVICELITGAAMAKGFVVGSVTKSNLFPLVYNSSLDVIFLDLAMPGMDGVEIIRFLAKKESAAGLVLMSGHEDTVLQAVRDLAIDHGLAVHGILRKPITSGELATVLDSIADTEAKAPSNGGRVDFLPQAGSDELPSAADLEMAIDNGGLSVAYQPQIDIASNRIVGFEGLARWRHPEKGAIPPGYFIPLAEEYDLIDGLTAYIVDFVTDDVKNNPDVFENMKISVNISEKLLSNLTLPENIVSNILSKNLSTKDFTFEITENTITSNPKLALDVLTRLRLKGVTLSIDDFGIGHSSLSRLRKIPFNEIKIDKSFIANFDYDIENRIIVENTISLAKKLSLTVVAEGIEKRIHLDLLKSLGCDVGQGFYFGRPMDVDGLSTWVTAWREGE
ncbi:MAG: EAL domain-containing protein [Rhodospirillaceae bacterium]|nr:EAL domain-containing protein [Rhodospirillaceae bacterium]